MKKTIMRIIVTTLLGAIAFGLFICYDPWTIHTDPWLRSAVFASLVALSFFVGLLLASDPQVAETRRTLDRLHRDRQEFLARKVPNRPRRVHPQRAHMEAKFAVTDWNHKS
jgi:hypothetical protein